MIYELKGTERMEETRDKIPCGDSVKTSYYDPETGKLLRRDVRIEVSEEFAKNSGLTSSTNFG